MARRYRLEYLRKKRAKERKKELRRQQALEAKAAREAWNASRSLKTDAEDESWEKDKVVPAGKEEKELSVVREMLGWVLYVAIIIAATYLIVTYVGQRTRVSGDSMLPSLHDEDNLIVDKISYRFRDPERYEIIVFPYKYQEDTYYIKRIIGLPGETVQIKDGAVYIDGELLGEEYGIEPIDEDKKGIAQEPISLGEDEYFVMGDNRNHSSDSRDSSVGVLNREDLIGRAWIRIWPLDSIGVIPHE